ncbi:MAG: M48 family metallopeptidase [Rhodopseudomonas palustris]|uniref:Protease HtpX homolog n=1 Tax=Rhodopseudomonas palustris TaxID=1076 RepID=A0A933W050_RHOPL|nr:M48 family metallopeptidase [Rhodopseudomonas palustris]
MAAYGLYTHIAANKTRSVVLLIGLFALIYVLVYAGALLAEVAIDSERPVGFYLNAAAADLVKALPFATIGAALWIAIAYFFNQKLIDAVTGGREVTRQEQPRLYNQLENLCISRGIAMPKLKVMDSPALNAFASGLNPRQYSITVTSGLLAALDDHEIEAVLGHELTHIRNGDVQMMVIAMIVAGVVGFFGEMFFRMFFQGGFRFGGGSGGSSSSSSSSSSDRKGGGGAVMVVILAIVLILLAWLLSQVVKLALSRSREYLADAGSVELTKNPDAMISALRKIENRGELEGATSAVMEMCVDNPRQGFADLFATHPSVDSRVAALVKFAGGRDPGALALPSPDDAADAETPPTPPSPEESAPPTPWTDTPPQPPRPGFLRGPWGRRA